jgi:hypothetical protein
VKNCASIAEEEAASLAVLPRLEVPAPPPEVPAPPIEDDAGCERGGVPLSLGRGLCSSWGSGSSILRMLEPLTISDSFLSLLRGSIV